MVPLQCALRRPWSAWNHAPPSPSDSLAGGVGWLPCAEKPCPGGGASYSKRPDGLHCSFDRKEGSRTAAPLDDLSRHRAFPEPRIPGSGRKVRPIPSPSRNNHRSPWLQDNTSPYALSSTQQTLQARHVYREAALAEVNSGLHKRVANDLPSTAKGSTTTQKSGTLRPHRSVAP